MNPKAAENNRRIVRNTGMLYFRMLLSMLVSLYTVRIVFNALGVIDYGIYGVVGGFVSIFIFMNGALSTSASRFIAFELGVDDSTKIRPVFQTAFTINLFFSLILFVLLETVGLWLMSHYLTIPSERLHSAKWVFHMSVLCAVISTLQVPLTALIVAYEKMNIYAYIGVADVLIKLGIAFSVNHSGYDKLITYAALIMISSIFIFSLYHIYCKKKIREYYPRCLVDKKHIKGMLGFSIWGFIGSFTTVMKLQGINVLLNIFFGPAVNASRAIAYQVNNAINGFTQNFSIAFRPQIIKYYAAGEINHMTELLISSAKFSYFMLFLLTLPVLFETDFILNLWLGDVSNQTGVFTKWVIINSLFESFTYAMYTALQASGTIKEYQLFVGGFLLLNVPLSYLFFKTGFPPESAFIISIILALCSLILRVVLIKKKIPQFPIRRFINNVFGLAFWVSLVVLPCPILIVRNFQPGCVRFFVSTISCVITSLIAIWVVGLNNNERRVVTNLVVQRMKPE